MLNPNYSASGHEDEAVQRVPMNWSELCMKARKVKSRAVRSFIKLYNRHKDRCMDENVWYEELDYMIVKLDHEAQKARVSLRAQEMLFELNRNERFGEPVECLWRATFASYMLRARPARPYGPRLNHMLTVEANMLQRRLEASRALHQYEMLISVASFPRLGCPSFTWPVCRPEPAHGVSRSLFVPDAVMNDHDPKYRVLAQHIRMRRGERVEALVPVFREYDDEGMPRQVTMDATAFGEGCGGLRVVMQACCVHQAMTLFDHMTVLAPLLTALTAASPAFRGHLTKIDSRLGVVAATADCRTRVERGADPMPDGHYAYTAGGERPPDAAPLNPRRSLPAAYLSPLYKGFNDLAVAYDSVAYNAMCDGGVLPPLAGYVARMCVRDPLVTYRPAALECGDVCRCRLCPHVAGYEREAFKELWRTADGHTVRLLPPRSRLVGWRVEFRPCDVQFTDFENAAFAIFVQLLCRSLLRTNSTLAVPMSMLHHNAAIAMNHDAVLNDRFWARNKNGVAEQMTMHDIINGKDIQFDRGLIGLVNEHLGEVRRGEDQQANMLVFRYMSMISSRAAGHTITTAAWIRRFVRGHRGYGGDAVVPDPVNYDMLRGADMVRSGFTQCPQLLGRYFYNPGHRQRDLPMILGRGRLDRNRRWPHSFVNDCGRLDRRHGAAREKMCFREHVQYGGPEHVFDDDSEDETVSSNGDEAVSSSEDETVSSSGDEDDYES